MRQCIHFARHNGPTPLPPTPGLDLLSLPIPQYTYAHCQHIIEILVVLPPPSPPLYLLKGIHYVTKLLPSSSTRAWVGGRAAAAEAADPTKD